MASTTTVLGINNTTARMKVSGADETATIALADLCASTQVVNSDTSFVPTVNIQGFAFVGDVDATVTVARNSVTIFKTNANAGNSVNLNMDLGVAMVDTQENTSDIDITFSGEGYLYLTLKKVTNKGYLDTFEPATVGVNDDLTKAGE